MQIGYGSKVSMHFSLILEDGTVAETSFEDEPLEFVLGDGTLIEGLEHALIGLVEGARQRLEIEPELAFGLPDPGLIHAFPAAQFSDLGHLEINQIIGFASDDGQELAGRVVAIENDQVRVDLNHPLAGHAVVFDVEILAVEPGSDQAS